LNDVPRIFICTQRELMAEARMVAANRKQQTNIQTSQTVDELLNSVQQDLAT